MRGELPTVRSSDWTTEQILDEILALIKHADDSFDEHLFNRLSALYQEVGKKLL